MGKSGSLQLSLAKLCAMGIEIFSEKNWISIRWRPQWWIFEDMSQREFVFAKKSVKDKHFLIWLSQLAILRHSLWTAPYIKLDLISQGNLKNIDINIIIFTKLWLYEMFRKMYYSIKTRRIHTYPKIYFSHYVWRSGSENAFVLPSCEQLDPLFHLFLGMAQL